MPPFLGVSHGGVVPRGAVADEIDGSVDRMDA